MAGTQSLQSLAPHPDYLYAQPFHMHRERPSPVLITVFRPDNLYNLMSYSEGSLSSLIVC